MRIAQLSEASGISVATVKFYLRAGLLPAGRPTARNQAAYDDSHLQRLRLVRVLIDVGNLPIAAVREVVAELDSPQHSLDEVVGVVHHALSPTAQVRPDQESVAARQEVDAWLAELGWQVSATAPGRGALTDAVVALRRLGRDVRPADLAVYADAALGLAAWELERTVSGPAVSGPAVSRAEVVERVVIGTVVYESVLLALRRLAQEHHFALSAADRAGKL